MRGTGAALALPSADAEAMQLYLDETAANVAVGAHAVLIFDRAGRHTTPNLVFPSSLTAIWLPSRAPELNPVENVWQDLRGNWLSSSVFETFDDIIDAACDAWRNLTARPEVITSSASPLGPHRRRSDPMTLGITASETLHESGPAASGNRNVEAGIRSCIRKGASPHEVSDLSELKDRRRDRF